MIRSMQRHVEVDEPEEDEFTIDTADLELQIPVSSSSAEESDDDSDEADDTAEAEE